MINDQIRSEALLPKPVSLLSAPVCLLYQKLLLQLSFRFEPVMFFVALADFWFGLPSPADLSLDSCRDEYDQNFRYVCQDYTKAGVFWKITCGTTKVPDNIPAKSLTVNLYFNCITCLPAGVFKHLSACTVLKLHKNLISVIKPGAFIGLVKLTRLTLYRNKLTSISSGLLKGLDNLVELCIEQNRISEIESGSFARMKNLRRLFLNDNKITAIKSGLFSGLNNLVTLCLMKNQISVIEPESFTNLNNVIDLPLYENKIAGVLLDHSMD